MADGLFDNQQHIGENVQKLLGNFQKANQARRRESSYLRNTHEEVSECMKQFQKNHAELVKLTDKTSNYFTNNYYEKVMSLYNKVFPVIVDLMNVQNGTPVINELVYLLKLQKIVFEQSEDLFTTIQQRVVFDKTIIDYYLTKLDGYLVRIVTIMEQIEELFSAHEQLPGYSPDDFVTMRRKISDTIEELMTKKLSMTNLSENEVKRDEEDSTYKVKLIQVEVPQFDGTLRKWPNFRDLYIDNIHNQKGYPASSKFHLLKSKLIGKAAGIISIMNTSAKNYESTWERVMEKYENEKLLVFDAYDGLFNHKAVKDDNHKELRDFVDNTRDCISILSMYNVDFNACESAIVYLLLSKLGEKNRELYEQQVDDCKVLPTLEDLFNFLEKRCHILQMMPALQKCKPKTPEKCTSLQATNISISDACIACGSRDHKIYDCIQFRALNLSERWNVAKSKNVCTNCFKTGHSFQECTWSTCGVLGCEKKHNSLLHYTPKNKNNDSKRGAKSKGNRRFKKQSTFKNGVSGNSGEVISNNQQTLSSSASEEDKFIFLGTALIYVEDVDKNKILCRALLDGGSQVNIITKRLAAKLRLKESMSKTRISGIGKSVTIANKVSFSISSRDFTFNSVVDANLMNDITSYSPTENINLNQFEAYSLADPNFNNSEPIDILIGNELVTEWESGNCVHLGSGLPSLKETPLGWVVIGKYLRNASQSNSFCGISVKDDFTLNAPTLWELEDFSTKGQLRSIEEDLAENNFKITTKRDNSSKFVVQLPKAKEIQLGNSFEIASRRSRFLEKRFMKDPSMFKAYHDFLDEYLKLGHMEKVPFNGISRLHYFLPHQAIVKDSSTTTKLRVVFDCSCKTSNNVSLNDILLKGPTIQSELFDILLRSRSHRYAISGDIEKMYRQVLVPEKDKFLQMLLWRNSPSEDLSFYKLTTLTYGTKSAPFLATKCLSELSRESSEQYPTASQIIKHYFYIDDLLSGADNLQDAKQIQSDLIAVLSILPLCHFELVSDLSTVAFLACLRRFIARRGKPVHIYSDNATNFVGAKEELKRLAEFFKNNSAAISEFTAISGINWTTIPARSSHFGGLWESNVKRAKFHIKDLVNNAQLTFDKLNTVIIESKNHLFSRYEIICKISQRFWGRFTKEYLITLQAKSKWTKPQENIKLNTLVLLKDSNLPPLKWKRGRIVSVFKGKDGLIRVVEVKTENGILRRAITEIAPLPIDLSEDLPEKILDNNILSTNLCLINNSSNIRVKNKVIKSNANSYFKFLLVLIVSILYSPTNANGSELKINTFSHHPGLYFDGIGKINIVEDRWHIITYYNLTNYWSQYHRFYHSLQIVQSLCITPACEAAINEIRNYLSDIDRLNLLIREECQLRDLEQANVMRKGRSRRSALWKPLNLLGNIAHKLTGVLDSDYAENMEKMIGNIKKNEVRQMMLLKNHTTILDNTVKVIRSNNEEIRKKMLYIETQIKGIRDTVSVHNAFNTLLMYLTLQVLKYRETQLQIHNVLLQFKQGKLNPLLISPEEFNAHLIEIQNSLGSTYNLPSTSFVELQDILEVAVTYGKNCILFHIEIPLLSNSEFNLYKLVPLPNFHLNKFVFIKPITEYMAISVQTQSYYLPNQDDIEKCTVFHNSLICDENHPIYSIERNNHCEVDLFLHESDVSNLCDVRSTPYPQFWIKLQPMNTWLYSVKGNSTIRLICKNNISSHTLFGEGIIEIPAGCSITSKGLKLHGKNITTSKLMMQKIPSVLPTMDFIKDLKLQNSSAPVILKLNDMNFISESIENLKALEDVPLEPVTIMDTIDTHQKVSYGLFIIIFVLAIAFIVIYICGRPTSTATNPVTNIEINSPAPRSKHNFELTEF